ncbi:MAG: type I secretion system permease/ATPase [Burkholderiaceae bacterium]
MSHPPLAEAARWLLAHHGQPISVAALFADLGLPTDLSPDHVVRALQDKGVRAAVLERSLDEIHGLLMPVVLILNDADACILLARLPESVDDPRRFKVLVPGEQAVIQCLTDEEMQARYSGFILAATPQLDQSHAATASGDSSPWTLVSGGHWLWGTLKRFLPYYRSTMIAALLSNVLMLVTGLVTAVIFDKVIPHQAFVTLWALAAGGLIAVVFDLIARQLRSHLIDTAGKKADMLLGSMLFRQTLGLRMENRPASVGAHSHHMSQIETVREFFASATVSAFTDLPFILLFIGMAFVIGGSIGWILVAAVPILVIMALLMQRTLRKAMQANMKHQADLQGMMVESLEGMEDLKASGAQGQFLRRFEAATAASAAAAIRSRRVSAITTNVSAVSQQLITLIILVWGVYLIDAKELSPGSMIACVMFGARAIAPLSSVVGLASRYQAARAALVALNHLMAQPQEREASRPYLQAPSFRGRLAMKDVSFNYPAPDPSAAPLVLRQINLEVKPGEKLAILGRIGSGKSTVLRLLAGLYQPSQGTVEVDGMDLRQLDPADYRPSIGFVSQEPRLFNETLRENVLMGRTDADATRLSEVAALTGLDRLVADHPLGWEMPVGEMGNLLSGGQRQLVALARALVTKPQILLMDEPTSSMDAQSELAFLRQLRVAACDCTLIMVTHRPAVLDLASRVLVIDGGRLVLDGPRRQVLDALSGQKGVAREIAASETAERKVIERPDTRAVPQTAGAAS